MSVYLADIQKLAQTQRVYIFFFFFFEIGLRDMKIADV